MNSTAVSLLWQLVLPAKHEIAEPWLGWLGERPSGGPIEGNWLQKDEGSAWSVRTK